MAINTGLTLRGFEVWAAEPGHYRHYHTLEILLPETFAVEAYEHRPGQWLLGFVRPDGIREMTRGAYSSREEAEEARDRYAGHTARLGCEFRVGYKQTDANGAYLPYAFCGAHEPGAKAWGTTWADPARDYAPLKFDLTPEEAERVIAWREAADAAWFAAHLEFLAREKRVREAQSVGLPEGAAEFVVDARDAFGADVVAVVGPLSRTATECLECGAVYAEPGHVEAGAMGCERCA